MLENPENTKQEELESHKYGYLRYTGTDRGIESLSRSLIRVQLALTALADKKASLMISLNGLIVSLIVLSSKILVDQNAYAVIPLVIWLTFSLAAMVFAIMSAMPRFFIRRDLSEENFLSQEASILYFGDIATLNRESYLRTAFKVLNDHHLTYEQIFSHGHALSLSLERKYRLLRTSYAVFLAGLLLASLAFAVTLVLSSGGNFIR